VMLIEDHSQELCCHVIEHRVGCAALLKWRIRTRDNRICSMDRELFRPVLGAIEPDLIRIALRQCTFEPPFCMAVGTEGSDQLLPLCSKQVKGIRRSHTTRNVVSSVLRDRILPAISRDELSREMLRGTFLLPGTALYGITQ
jgi:hypothetical protein